MATETQDHRLGQLRQWMDEGRLPEVVATHQDRSLRSALSMLDAGREIISEGTYEDLSVEAVCQLAGTTVGTFYGRFENKEKFFVTLQRLQSFRSQALLAQVIDRHSKGKPNLDRLVQDMVELMVGHFRSNFGIMRASLQHTKEGMWQVLKASGDLHRAAFAGAMAPLLPLPAEQARRRVLFAYQVLAGVLVHSVLNNPGPLDLQHKDLVPELVRLLRSYLVVDDGAAAPKA